MKISPKTLTFLRAIKRNNNRDWFAEHKPQYKQLHADFAQFMYALGEGINDFDKALKKSAVKDSTRVFRIYRDARFSKDKSPYKTNFGGYIVPGGKTFNLPGYYLHIEPGNSFVGGGIWHPEKKILYNIRDYVAEDFKKLDKILADKKFKKTYGELSEDEALKTVPRGYDKDHPAAKYLRHKNFAVMAKLSDKDVTSPGFSKKVLRYFETLRPLVAYLRKAAMQ